MDVKVVTKWLFIHCPSCLFWKKETGGEQISRDKSVTKNEKDLVEGRTGLET